MGRVVARRGTAAKTETRRRASAEASDPPALSKSEATRRRILDAAARVFAQNGYADTRLSDIATEADTFAGSIYYYFESREDLVEEVLRLGVTGVFDAVRDKVESMPADSTHRARITTAIATHLLFTLKLNHFATANQRLFAQVPSEIRQRHIHVHRAYGEYWRKLLEGARRAGELRRDIDLSVLRLQILGAINWTVEWYKPGKRSIEQIASQLAVTIFDGIAS
ncbi:TetR/AcrR family transcriptional regulator [Reyranella sp. CPCC 100927]|uniref:TetR/AcrR family transcriptional regulator n=1 Tax=Reyranella sp. CPCC 100927 TaxID=2599616 RepID=UPI0011B83BCB|nr:TetR/AcrR family transcriptional regulator [Reyranella sp. CPCC 100927]TWT15213.1 TetR/AcrR family transcriptional regulator [Reyranella sp. CPCC 100927]